MRVSPPFDDGLPVSPDHPLTVPAAFLIFSEFSALQAVRARARVTDLLTPAYDHQVAGADEDGGGPVIWIGMAVVFFRWANANDRRIEPSALA